MKVNNPNTPKFPILINNEEGLKMEIRLHNLGWKHLDGFTLKGEYFAHFPLEIKPSKLHNKYYFL